MFVRGSDEDTICALSTAPGVGGIAVIRVSGAKALAMVQRLCSFLPASPESHKAFFGVLRGLDGVSVDEVVALYFAHGRSFTGEETVEISCHGGNVLSASILRELVSAGCRMSRKGEFTYRAFMNGRLDLVQAESVLSLIESQSKQAAKAALRQLQGHLSAEFARVEDDLVWLLAHLEANIDFSSEGIEVVKTSVLVERTESLIAFVEKMIGTYAQGRLLREGLQIALVGRPNAGKSSFLNALLNEDRAIVTEHAGTTRDTIEGRVSVAGVPVTFIDTAGLRETENEIERMGIARTRSAMAKSDLLFYVIDLTSSDLEGEIYGLKEAGNDAYPVFNKIDLDVSGSLRARAVEILQKKGLAENALVLSDRIFWVSASTGEGVDRIEALVAEHAKLLDSETSNVVTQARHLELLQKIHSCLRTAVGLMTEDSSPEFIAFELQEAVRAIHELLGKEFDEQVIDRIFKEFCLGK